MNPNLYPGGDPKIQDLANRIDSNSNSKVDANELHAFLEATDIKPDQSDLLKNLSSKENELRKIDGLEQAITQLALKLITDEDLKKALPLSKSQESIVLLYEGLYGGKKSQAIDSQQDSEKTAESTAQESIQDVEQTAETPTLTPQLRDKYTLKRSITNISGLPAGYVANLDDITLTESETVTSAKLTLHMNEAGVLVTKEVKENDKNNDSQTIIKFEKQADNSWILAKEIDKEKRDSSLIRLDDGIQVLRFPHLDHSVSDKKVTFINKKLILSDHNPSTEPKKALDEKLGNAELTNLVPIIDKNNKGAYYYAHVRTRDGKFLGAKDGSKQIVLFDIHGTPIEGQVIKSQGAIGDKKDKTPGYFTTTTLAQEKYATESNEQAYNNYVKENNSKIIKGVFNKTLYDTLSESEKADQKLKLTIDKTAPELTNIVVDYVAQEGKIHIGSITEHGIVGSHLTIFKDNLNDGKELPIFLKNSPDTGGYYIIQLNKDTLTIKKDIQREQQIVKLKAGYDNFLERTAGSATYGTLDKNLSISQPTPVENMEDKVFEYEGNKRPLTDIIFAVTVGMDELSSQSDTAKRSGIIDSNKAILTANIKLAGNTVQGFVPPTKWENDIFYPAREGEKNKTIIIETPTGLLEYKVGVKQKRGQKNIHFEPIYLDPTQDESVTKTLINQYKDSKGIKLFENKTFTRIENSKGEIQGYIVDTTANSGKAYTAFDMKGNIIGREQLQGLVTKDKVLDLTSIALDTSYQVVNKNERTIGLTNEGKELKTHEQLVKESPQKITSAIQNGGFTLIEGVKPVQITASKPVEGFYATVKNSTGKTYVVNFTLEGEVNSALGVYESGTPNTKLKSHIINNKLFIADEKTITTEQQKAQAAEQRAKLLEGYPRDGVVRIMKDDKVYQINKEQSKRFAYEQLAKAGNQDAAKQDSYTKKLETINTDYEYKGTNLTSYSKDTLFYTSLESLQKNPAVFTEANIRTIISESKKQALSDIEKTKPTPAEQQRLDQSIQEFVSTADNFKDYPVTDKMVLANNTPSTNQTKSASTDKKENSTDKTKSASTDKKESSTNQTKSASTDKKENSTDKTKSASTNQKENSTDKKETKEQIPNFTWARRNKQPPAMSFKFTDTFNTTHTVDAKNQFDLQVANQDRSKDFKNLLSAVQTMDASYSPKLQALQDIIKENNNSKSLVGKVQNWAATYAGIGDKVDSWKLGDSKLGINTYTALLTALYITKSSATNPTVTQQWNNFKQYFNNDVTAGASVAHKSAVSDSNYA